MKSKPEASAPATPFEEFVRKIAAVPKEAVQALEDAREKRPRFRRKPKQPAK